ncbi:MULTISPECIES: SusC/RagA family TonB-linked outer membrane protein [Butyricimonas]|uniref:SusC/RagA family TonB-linked outer membrane protein n=1 Tax=Butyricimonas TaxID=574697 RepID=UPI0016525A6A|nr:MULTISPECIES: SusC/RagA family TonB-linked outer membrane protein [Butyricimonas]
MKLCLILICVFSFGLSATTVAQQERVSLNLENVTLKTVLDKIQEQTDLNFMVNREQAEILGLVSVNVKNETVKNVLDRVLENSQLTYTFMDKIIVIKVRQTEPEKKSVRVKGFVHDAQKSPMPGVTVKVTGVALGTTTNVQGWFALDLPITEGSLEFSFIGFKKQTVPFNVKTDTLHIVMEEDLEELEEVVSLGYFNQDKRTSTSAITSLKMDDIMQPGVATLDQMLEGRVPGMIFMQNSGQVGATPKIKIRGTTTLLGSTQPLYVLDGVILDDPVNIDAADINSLDYVNLLGNAISGLNPSDIDQIDVLKDASATAIYGPKASNGVIVITTKKGKVGKPSISYSLTGTFRQRPRYTDRAVNVMNSMERIAYSREAIQAGWRVPTLKAWVGYESAYSDLLNNKISHEEFVERVDEMETANTDWLGILLQDTYSHNHTVSVSGGTENLRYYSSVGYMDDRGNTRGEVSKRYSAMANLNLNYAKWDFRFGLNGNLQKKEYTPDNDQGSVANYAYTTSRSVPAYTKDGELLYYDVNPSGYYVSDFNMINEMKNSWKHIDTDQIGLQISLGYRFIPSLKFDVNFSYNVSHTDEDVWFGENSYYAISRRNIYKRAINDYVPGDQNKATATLVNGGELRLSNTTNESYNLRGTLSFNKALNEDQSLNASLIGEVRSSKYSGFKITKRNYLPDRGMIFDDWDQKLYEDFTEWSHSPEARGALIDNLTRQVSTIASVSWSWRNTYILNGNMRMDWSNKFGDRSNEKFLPIWSLSGRWNMHDNLLYGVSWVNTFALKLSFGYQGNMSNTESPRLIIKKGGTNIFFDEFESEIVNFPNPVLSWEKTATFNGSVEFALFNRKLTGNVGYYYRRTTDAFMEKTVAYFNGTKSYTVNAGILVNQGFEFNFSFTPINNMINKASSALSASGERRGFRWRFDPNFGSVFNQLVDKIKPKDRKVQDNDISISQYLNGEVPVSGRPVNTFYSYRFKGLNHDTGAPEFYGVDDSSPVQKKDEKGNLVYDEGGNPVMLQWSEVYKDMDKEDVWLTYVLGRSGCREPFLQGSISNTFEYNNWVLAFNFAYSIGSKIRLFKMYNDNGSIPRPEVNMRRDWTNRWRVPGDEKYTNIPGIVGGATYEHMNIGWWKNNAYDWNQNYWQMYDNSDVRLASGNYLKLSSVQLRYVVPERICKYLYMQSAYVSVSGTNLFTLCSKKLKGQDPSQSGTTSLINISVRPTYSLTLNVTF